jgi:hypothetical protein
METPESDVICAHFFFSVWNLAEGNGGCNGPIKHPGQSEHIYGTEQKTGMFACDFFQRKVHLLEHSLTDNHFQSLGHGLYACVIPASLLVP